jgi:uncharacterized protein YdbL (DUF1318 family)
MSMIKQTLILIPTILLTLGLSTPTIAASLAQAKAAGHVGEQLNGYLGLVNPNAPADVKAMVAEINAKRRAEYERIAKKNGVNIDQVARVTASKVISQAPPGTYVQTASGWIKK